MDIQCTLFKRCPLRVQQTFITRSDEHSVWYLLKLSFSFSFSLSSQMLSMMQGVGIVMSPCDGYRTGCSGEKGKPHPVLSHLKESL